MAAKDSHRIDRHARVGLCARRFVDVTFDASLCHSSYAHPVGALAAALYEP